MSLSEALKTTAIDIMSDVVTPKRYMQLQAKDLPKVPTWRLKRDSNSRLSGRKASTLSLRHHAPFIRSLYQSYIHSFVHLFIHSFICSAYIMLIVPHLRIIL